MINLHEQVAEKQVPDYCLNHSVAIVVGRVLIQTHAMHHGVILDCHCDIGIVVDPQVAPYSHVVHKKRVLNYDFLIFFSHSIDFRIFILSESIPPGLIIYFFSHKSAFVIHSSFLCDVDEALFFEGLKLVSLVFRGILACQVGALSVLNVRISSPFN